MVVQNCQPKQYEPAVNVKRFFGLVTLLEKSFDSYHDKMSCGSELFSIPALLTNLPSSSLKKMPCLALTRCIWIPKPSELPPWPITIFPSQLRRMGDK